MIVDCAICLEATSITKEKNFFRNRGSNDAILKCQHVFHRKCIKKWISDGDNGTTCPCCRQPIKLKESYEYYSFILLYPLKKAIKTIEFFLDKYIYYDNASIILFIKYILINVLHFSYTKRILKKSAI